MTGFGRGAAGAGEHAFVVTAQGWNHRHAELMIRLPEDLRELEPEVRELARARFARGRCEVQVRRRVARSGAGEAALDVAAVASFLDQVRPLVESGSVEATISAGDLTRPAFLVRREAEAEITAEDRDPLLAAVSAALAEFDADRSREGRSLQSALGVAVGELRAIVADLGARHERWSGQLRERVRARLEEILPHGATPVPEERLAQEVVLLADRSDVTEELERLASHLEAYESVVAQPGPHGKRLDFWSQEISRELNTLGAKCRDAETTARVVDAKVINERLREQVQNVE